MPHGEVSSRDGERCTGGTFDKETCLTSRIPCVAHRGLLGTLLIAIGRMAEHGTVGPRERGRIRIGDEKRDLGDARAASQIAPRNLCPRSRAHLAKREPFHVLGPLQAAARRAKAFGDAVNTRHFRKDCLNLLDYVLDKRQRGIERGEDCFRTGLIAALNEGGRRG